MQQAAATLPTPPSSPEPGNPAPETKMTVHMRQTATKARNIAGKPTVF
jgi:hypothetical protein